MRQNAPKPALETVARPFSTIPLTKRSINLRTSKKPCSTQDKRWWYPEHTTTTTTRFALKVCKAVPSKFL